MTTDEFRKHYGKGGYTESEVELKMAKVAEAHGVGTPESKWQEPKIVPDPRGGFMVIISTKD